MFIRLLVFALLFFAIFSFVRWYQRTPKVDSEKLIWRGSMILIILVLVGLALTGRLNWLFALFAAMIPLARRIIPLLRYLPLVRNLFQQVKGTQAGEGPQANQGRSQAGSNSEPNPGTMTRAQALKILGLDDSATREEIIKAHKRLIQKAHPDRGGSDWLATQINEARDYLLKQP